MQPLTRWQKVIAYAALAVVGLWTAWGLFAIWVMWFDPHR